MRLRIDAHNDLKGKTDIEKWLTYYRNLQTEVAEKIEQFASRAEATNYKNKGNITRHITSHPHQLVIDYCIHDIDYLNEFIKDYSRGRRP